MCRKVVNVIWLMLALIMILGSSTSAFGVSEAKISSVENCKVSDYERNNYIKQVGKNFIVKGDQSDFILPQKATGKIVVKNEECFSFKLPNIAEDTNGIMNSKGEMVYNTENKGRIAVTALKQEQGGIVFDGLCVSISERTNKGVQKYKYEYSLESNQRIVSAKEYMGKNTGEVYIVGQDGDIAVVDSAVATDSHGNRLNSHYEIEGETIVQVVYVPKDEIITVSSTTHPNKTITSYLTKNMTKQYLDSMGMSTKESMARGAEILVIGMLPGGAPVATLMGIADLWSLNQKNKVEEIYKSMKANDYLKITIIATWRNGGKNSGYIYGIPKYNKVSESQVPASILKKIKGK
ncbi:MAG: hypothetical protein Q4E84_01155 [Clostridia bacterium]|nr:hypothetical protein [Clostridia bacterium]